jgi:ABC-2 type transport system ATP-binding protein
MPPVPAGGAVIQDEASMNATAIEMENVVKVYPNGVRALDSVTLAVPHGSICTFLGRNGAGKTTTVRVLSTLSRKTSGRAAVCGVDIDARPAEVRRLIGVALQNSGLDGLMTGREHLELIAGLAGYRRKDRRRRADELLEMVGLAGAAGRVVAKYSGGMRRRLDLCLALIHRPRVLFLDELGSGLDLQSRLAVWEIIRDLRAGGTAVFLATHDLSEADRLSDLVAVIDAGRIRAVGSPAELRQACPADVVVDQPKAAGPSLEDVFVHLTGSDINIDATGPGTADTGVLRAAGASAP